MLQLKNSTPFAANMALFPDEYGVDSLYLIVKASFNIGQQWVLSDEQTLPFEEDEFWGEPDKSSLKNASDFHIGKPVTDIIMVGHACSPNKKSVNQLDVSLSVGKVQKTIRVFGDREWKDGCISVPATFQTMPLVYENAFGGLYIKENEEVQQEERNPVGTGFSGGRSIKDMNGIKLPNLEDPENLISQHIDTPEPACFSFCASCWQPRVSYSGTYDEAWQTQRAPYLPLDFDKRFFNMAHKSLVYPGYLCGGESVQITNMHPRGNVQFSLPYVNLVSSVYMGKKEYKPTFNLETLMLDPNKMQLNMVWRASMACDKKVLKVHEINISLSK